MTSTAEFQKQRAACERERAAIQDRIDDMEEQLAALEGRIRWLTGKIDSGRRSVPDAAGTTSKPVDLTSAILGFVRSQSEPVSAPGVMAYLRSIEVPFTEKSISGLLGRHACRVDEVDNEKPLRKVSRGLYAPNVQVGRT